MKNTESTLDPKVVAERAYQLYQARGGEPGHDFEDWIRAEQELRKSKPQGRAPQSNNQRGKR